MAYFLYINQVKKYSWFSRIIRCLFLLFVLYFLLYSRNIKFPPPAKKKKTSLHREICKLCFQKKKWYAKKCIFLLSKTLFYLSIISSDLLSDTRHFKLKTIWKYLGSRQGTTCNCYSELKCPLEMGNWDSGCPSNCHSAAYFS